MGLGAPKRRNKLSHDPNNTAWSKSTENFGHRILSSQGWKPGEYLGASNASHADHYTAANASHIRVLLREDNLGLGAKIGGAGNAETFGLSTLSGIFGRLNGKSDVEVQKQQSNLRDAELQTYQARKYGFMNFVSGGLLVGDKMEMVKKDALPTKTSAEAVGKPVEEEKNSKKRKAVEDVPEPVEEKRLKRKKASADLRAAPEISSAGEPEHETSVSAKKSKKEKKRGEDELVKDPAADAEEESKEARRARKAARRAERTKRQSGSEASADEKARAKEEKRARKEERRKRKEEKRLLRAQKAEKEAAALPTPPSGVSTPTMESLAFGGSRHAVRQRYIQQKRLASLDPQALKEILMIKAQV